MEHAAGIMSIVRIPDAEVDRDMDRDLRSLLCECFTKPEDAVFRERRYFTEPPRMRWVARCGDQLVGHVAGHDKVLRSRDRDLRVIGIAEVCVNEGFRGRGLARRMLEHAHRWGVSEGFDFAVLFGQASIYRSSGYRPIESPLRVTDAQGRESEGVRADAMYFPFRKLAWPADTVDLRGPVF